jgi:hypothetical protein
MSDFLRNLVIRSLGTAPVIRPRLPSLFEPATPYLLSLPAISPGWDEGRREAREEAAIEEADRLPDAPPVRPAATRKGRVEASVGLPPSVAQPYLARDLAQAPPRDPANRASDAVPAPPFGGGIPREAGPAAPPAVAGVLSVEEHFGWPSALPSESALDERRTEQVAVSATPRRQLPATTAQPWAPAILRTEGETPEGTSSEVLEAKSGASRQFHETIESRAQSEAEESARSQVRDSAPRAPAAIEAPRAPHFEFARHVAPSQPVSPPEPTIQVTIGRIEVRAVSSQAASPKERSASPVMSLNDYLRSRRGGA